MHLKIKTYFMEEVMYDPNFYKRDWVLSKFYTIDDGPHHLFPSFLLELSSVFVCLN